MKHLSKEMARNLFDNTTIPLGVRVEFFFRWSEWIKTSSTSNFNASTLNYEEQPTSNLNTALTSNFDSQEKTPSNQIKLDLKEILESNTYGISLMKSYRSNNQTMTENFRKLLLESILLYCVENNHDLTTKDCSALASQICDVFPGEIAVIFFPLCNRFQIKSNEKSFTIFAFVLLCVILLVILSSRKKKCSSDGKII